ncbi:hypothetical protein V1478_012690 [Vespula squamosa]|uniref:Uncharacterized protein n=1 Tax=Vespula squamosa TaxID=30214 RepID=A0ABD2ABB6_VESSQ
MLESIENGNLMSKNTKSKEDALYEELDMEDINRCCQVYRMMDRKKYSTLRRIPKTNSEVLGIYKNIR